MKKEFMTTLKYGLQYIVTAFVLLALTGNIDFEYSDASDWIASIAMLLAPVVVMIIVNLMRVHHDEKLIEEIRKEEKEVA